MDDFWIGLWIDHNNRWQPIKRKVNGVYSLLYAPFTQAMAEKKTDDVWRGSNEAGVFVLLQRQYRQSHRSFSWLLFKCQVGLPQKKWRESIKQPKSASNSRAGPSGQNWTTNCCSPREWSHNYQYWTGLGWAEGDNHSLHIEGGRGRAPDVSRCACIDLIDANRNKW